MRRQARWLLLGWIVALIVYAAWALRLQGSLRPFGDEPTYLALAHSLAFDRDLDLRNNLQGTDLPVVDYRGDGHLRALQNIGLPLLLALPYRLGGVLGARLAIAACAVLLWGTLVRLAHRATGSRRAALAATALVGLTLPVLPYAGTIWTEIPAATLVALGCWLALREERPGNGTLLGVGCLAAFLPWLHVRYIPLAGALLLWAGFRSGRFRSSPWTAAGALLVPQLLSYGLLSACFWHLYGSPWPGAPYRASFGWPWFVWNPAHLYRGLAGLFLDQEFGLLFYAPYLVAALAGLARLRDRALAWTTAAVLAGLALPAGLFVMWWGGDSPPARLILPAVPLLTVPLAQALASWKGTRFRLPFALLALWSLFLTGLYVWHPEWLLTEDGDRISRPLQELGWAHLAALFPSTAVKTIDYRVAGEPQVVAGGALWDAAADVPQEARLLRFPLILPRGRHRVAVRMQVLPLAPEGDGPVVRLQVRAADGSVVAEREILSADLPGEGAFCDCGLTFGTESEATYSFEVERTGPAALWLERVRVGPASPWIDLLPVALWSALFAGLGFSWARMRPAARASALTGKTLRPFWLTQRTGGALGHSERTDTDAA